MAKAQVLLNHVTEFNFIAALLLKRKVFFKKMAPFYGWGSTASRLEPLRGDSNKK